MTKEAAKAEAIKLLQEGYGQAEVARATNLSTSTVSRLVTAGAGPESGDGVRSRKRNPHQVHPRKRLGRHEPMSDEEADDALCRSCCKDTAGREHQAPKVLEPGETCCGHEGHNYWDGSEDADHPCPDNN